jgi:hypothetical protein
LFNSSCGLNVHILSNIPLAFMSPMQQYQVVRPLEGDSAMAASSLWMEFVLYERTEAKWLGSFYPFILIALSSPTM